jgi:peptide/nickel transport system permease protein
MSIGPRIAPSLGASLRGLALRDPLATAGAAFLVMLILISALGPLLPIGDPTEIGIGPRLSAPAAGWPLGTDELGRSNLPRLVEGINATFLLASTAVLLTAVIGILAGMAAGYVGGLVDIIVMRFADILFSFPPLLLAIFIAAMLGSGGGAAIIAIVAVTLPLFVRVVRAVTLSVVERGFVIAAEVSGASVRRILFMHVLPNVAGAAIIQLTYALSVGMLVESALSFLGLGVQPPGASLGSLLRQGAVYMTIAPWLVFPEAAVLTIAIMSVNLLGDGLRDALDPLGGRALR